jgi:hypothetical protein
MIIELKHLSSYSLNLRRLSQKMAYAQQHRVTKYGEWLVVYSIESQGIDRVSFLKHTVIDLVSSRFDSRGRAIRRELPSRCSMLSFTSVVPDCLGQIRSLYLGLRSIHADG